MKDMIAGLTEDAEGLLIGAMVVLAVWFIIWTWVTTKSLAPTIGALLVGALVVWGVSNIRFLADKVDEDIPGGSSTGGGARSGVPDRVGLDGGWLLLPGDSG
jgi:hypothetical protein